MIRESQGWRLPTGGRRTWVYKEFSKQILQGRMGKIFHVEEAANSKIIRKWDVWGNANCDKYADWLETEPRRSCEGCREFGLEAAGIGAIDDFVKWRDLPGWVLKQKGKERGGNIGRYCSTPDNITRASSKARGKGWKEGGETRCIWGSTGQDLMEA